MYAFFYSAAGLLAFIICWQLLVTFTGVGNIFPSPYAVLLRLIESFGKKIGKHMLYTHLFYSLFRVTAGYLAAAVLGI